jgi:cyclophilin family peptidyl-prolyl cis-trans isomerase
MNFTLDDTPYSGEYPLLFMDISVQNRPLGKIYIELFRDVFPAAVENFVYMCKGTTYRTELLAQGANDKHRRYTQRSYNGSKFYQVSHNNYIAGGDIYKNNGTDGATIYYDAGIDVPQTTYFYPHDDVGLISLIPYYDADTRRYFFDSNFLITLDKPKPTNILYDLDRHQLVIGRVYKGLDILTQINNSIVPFAGRNFPNYSIDDCGVYASMIQKRRHRPVAVPFNPKNIIRNKPIIATA